MGSLRSIRFGVLGGVVALVAVFGLSYLLADTRAGQGESNKKGGGMKREAMEREIIRVEPIATNFEKWGVPVSVCTRAGNMVFVSGMPPFDPETGEIAANAPFERQADLILTQLKTVLEAAGSDLDHVLKCNVLCISKDRFKTFNEIYKRFFPTNPPARIFFCVPEWTGPFDIEVDCIALTKS